MIISKSELSSLLSGRNSDPHTFLGLHPSELDGKSGLVARTFVRDAISCEIVRLDKKPERRFVLKKLDDNGFFEGFIPRLKKPFKYRIRITHANGEVRQFYDPYSFMPTLGEQDLHLFSEGNDLLVYDKMGGHLREIEGVKGASFAVWAPNARRVSVVGDFNHWDGRYHSMRNMGSSGIWEIFIPGLEAETKYKYEIVTQEEHLLLKTDPYGVYFEPPPHNCSILYDLTLYKWKDKKWIDKRSKTLQAGIEPISIYEVHLGSWKKVVEDGGRPLSYHEAAEQLGEYVRDMGFTHVEFMPLAEHPFTGSWGYQVTGFFAPTHRYGHPDEFRELVDVLHQKGIGVIMDWVPAHFPRDTFALAEFDGTHLYEHADPRQGHHKDWGTLIFNYGRNEVVQFLVGCALSWMERYHIDGLRVDAVASMLYLDYSREEGEWIPNVHGGRENIDAIHFLRKTNSLVHKEFPGVLMIAEESTSFGGVTKSPEEGGLGFDFKWNMGWMHDTLLYFGKDALYRKWHHNNLTFGMLYQFSEDFVSVFSHDEVVHGKGSMITKMAGESITEKSQTLRSLYGYMWAYPGKKCLFMGTEFGQSSEWRYDGSLDWHLCQYADHEGIRLMVKDINRLYLENKALFERDNSSEGFQWIDCNDAESGVLSFVRRGHNKADTLVVVCHFTPVSRSNYRVGVPFKGKWKELMNTNAWEYGGTGTGNLGEVHTQDHAYNDMPVSVELTIPGLTTLWFKWEGEE
ncbi:MAG: 1,4-alpha-glucan branching protein GlgB [Nitrospirae bacterium]|nr:1,4-alpha-glucan branching protein GlgB [Verrucomicrobiota bacterium]MCZ6801247.1 1,4-alpha-glucan branching protein GlgB [Nitrospirota bacterium]